MKEPQYPLLLLLPPSILSTAREVILLLAVFGFWAGRPEWLDIALTYGFLNLIGTLAVLKFFRHGDLAYDVGEEEEADGEAS